jgi:ABC-2 type transport system permease protein
MLRETKILTALELKNIFGLNTLRHTKDKAKKRNAALLSVAWVMLIAMVVFYVLTAGLSLMN